MNQERNPADEGEAEGERYAELWQSLFPTAIELLREALREGSSTEERLQWRAKALHQAYPDGSSGDELREVKAALASALTEYLRWREKTELSELPGEDELAFHLIRITYNRWKRRSRADRKIQRAADLGQLSLDEEGESLLSGLAEKNLHVREEFARNFNEVLVLTLKGFNHRHRGIVQLHLEKRTQKEIAEIIQCNRATVFRVIERFRDRFKKLFADEARS